LTGIDGSLIVQKRGLQRILAGCLTLVSRNHPQNGLFSPVPDIPWGIEVPLKVL